MSENNDIQVIQTTEPEGAAEIDNVVKFSKPYKFEGETYQSVDLSGLADLTADDMIAADRHLTSSGNFTVMPEMSLGYALFIAARVSGKPLEFFKGLPAKEALKVKNRVTGFFYGGD